MTLGKCHLTIICKKMIQKIVQKMYIFTKDKKSVGHFEGKNQPQKCEMGIPCTR